MTLTVWQAKELIATGLEYSAAARVTAAPRGEPPRTAGLLLVGLLGFGPPPARRRRLDRARDHCGRLLRPGHGRDRRCGGMPTRARPGPPAAVPVQHDPVRRRRSGGQLERTGRPDRVLRPLRLATRPRHRGARLGTGSPTESLQRANDDRVLGTGRDECGAADLRCREAIGANSARRRQRGRRRHRTYERVRVPRSDLGRTRR